MTGPGGTDADRAARERLAREARETATALLDWVGTRVDGAATARADGTSARPRQSAGPCTWCPVCALVAALRGEQPELTATLAEQASGLLVVLRLLVQAHATGGHGPHPADPDLHQQTHHPAPDATGRPATEEPAASPPADAGPEVPWDVAPHALFDPDPDPGPTAPDPTAPDAATDEPPRPAPERPTGKRGPRPSPRRQTAAAGSSDDGDGEGVPTPPVVAAEPRPFPQPLPQAPPTTAARPPAAPVTAPGPVTPAAPVAGPAPVGDRSGRVQRIPVRRRTRPC